MRHPPPISLCPVRGLIMSVFDRQIFMFPVTPQSRQNVNYAY